MNLLDKYEVKSTFFCCALAFERNPEVARAVVERGHEVCGHGYRWEEYHSKTREEEEEAIRKTVESLTATTGERPLGWFTRYGPSVNTRELVASEGGFIYDSGVLNDDLPYYTDVNGKPWLVIPYSFETNDARFWRGGLNSVGDFYEYLKDTFDVLYEEGARASEDDVGRAALPHRRSAGALACAGPIPAVCGQSSGSVVRAARRDSELVAGKISPGHPEVEARTQNFAEMMCVGTS